jgi:predicted transposase/invertase (TIGR01784 family)
MDVCFKAFIYIRLACSIIGKVERIPEGLKEKIFEKLFATAELAKLTPDQAQGYRNSLKHYRDMKNSIDTAAEKAKEEGKKEEKKEIARKLLARQMDMATIVAVTDLSIKEIEQLKKES